VAAAQRLLERGEDPSVDDVARAAEVSRRTIYLHFPTLDQLLLDATAGLEASGGVEEAMRSAADDGLPALERTMTVVEAVIRQSAETLPLGRRILRLTAEPAAAPSGAPSRGFRRMGWLESAIGPLRLSDAGRDRLLAALAALCGWETMLVLEDVRGLRGEDAVQVALWAARLVVEGSTAATG